MKFKSLCLTSKAINRLELWLTSFASYWLFNKNVLQHTYIELHGFILSYESESVFVYDWDWWQSIAQKSIKSMHVVCLKEDSDIIWLAMCSHLSVFLRFVRLIHQLYEKMISYIYSVHLCNQSTRATNMGNQNWCNHTQCIWLT